MKVYSNMYSRSGFGLYYLHGTEEIKRRRWLYGSAFAFPYDWEKLFKKKMDMSRQNLMDTDLICLPIRTRSKTISG